VTEIVGRPAYQQVADDLRERIAAAEFLVGAAVPSTAKLTKTYGVSSTVVRAAIAQLRAEGLLVGQPGKGVFVRATPEGAAARAATVEELSEKIEELHAELCRIDSARHGEVAGELAALRQRVELIDRYLAELYAQLGRPYPGGSGTDVADLGRPAGGQAGGEGPTPS
jgi:GntR family transcriptional regulator